MNAIQIGNIAITPGVVKGSRPSSMDKYELTSEPSRYLTYDFFNSLIGQEHCIKEPPISGTRGDYITDMYSFPAFDVAATNEDDPDTHYYFVFGHIKSNTATSQYKLTKWYQTNYQFWDAMEVHICTMSNGIFQTSCNSLDIYPFAGNIIHNFIVTASNQYGVGIYALDNRLRPDQTGHALVYSYSALPFNDASAPRPFVIANTQYEKDAEISPYNSFNWTAAYAQIPNIKIFYFGSTLNETDSAFDLARLKPPTGIEPVDGQESSGTDYGGGTFSAWGDNIDYADPPSNSALSSNLLTMFKLTNEEVSGISHFLYSNDFILNVKKLFTNPFDYLVNFQLLPIDTSNTITANVCIGGLDTEVTGERLTTQYWQSNELYLDVNEYYGSFADYSPDTRIHLYVPFCGFREVRVEDVMAGGIGIKFNVDMLTGDVVAQVKMYGAYTQSIMYTLAGNCSAQAPLTGRDYSNIYRTALSQTVSGINHGNPVSGAVGGAMTIALSKPSVQRGGAISGNAGQLSQFTPYLLFTRPAISQPGDYAHYKGRPSNITRRLRDLTGYTEVDTLITEGFSKASAAEMEMIRAALKGGVYL